MTRKSESDMKPDVVSKREQEYIKYEAIKGWDIVQSNKTGICVTENDRVRAKKQKNNPENIKRVKNRYK